MVTKIKKRDGRIVPFEKEKIYLAIFKSAQAVGGHDKETARELMEKVVKIIEERFKDKVPDVETVQDIVEKTLVENRHYKTAKAYILYREQHKQIREVSFILTAEELIQDYLENLDWRIKENSNMAYSLQGLNNHIMNTVTKRFWLNSIYPNEIRRAHDKGDVHIHDLGILAPYCCGWDLKDIIMRGFGGVGGKIESAPPKHFRTALGQLINFLYTLQGESAGAQAVSNFDSLMAPFVKYDKLNYKEVKQCMQEFVFNMNVPTRVGFQTPFSNITMDLKVPAYMRDEHVIIGGKPQKETYKEFQKEMDMINRAFAEVMMKGDAKGRVFTFPIPTYNITKDFDWSNELYDSIWEMTAKYGIPYFSNFVNSDMKPEDARSMCCRLRLDNRELRKRGGGLFGANPLTGSIGVVTINLPRIGYLSKSDDEFLKRLGLLMDLAMESLEVKRKVLEKFTERGLYPYSKVFLEGIKKRFGSFWKNHFSTIGINGMNEAMINFLGFDLSHEDAREFALKILDFMRERIAYYQDLTGHLYNLEATPGEGTSYSLALKDKKIHPGIKAANEKDIKQGFKPYYTNSSQLPVGMTDDLFEALDLQDDFQTKYTGGCIEKGNFIVTDKGLIKIEDLYNKFDKLKPIKTISYNNSKRISEWDEITNAFKIDVKKHNKIRIKAERNLDITTSDWHPFFVLEKIKPNEKCPVCNQKLKNIKNFAAHLKNNRLCQKQYKDMEKYLVKEKRADELKKGDYILQNYCNLHKNKSGLDSDLAWLVGFFIGDGSISEYIDNKGGNKIKKTKVRFFSEHEKTLEKTSKILKKYFKTEVKVIKNDKRSAKLSEVSCSKKQVVDFFLKFGFKKGKKVYDVHVPKKIKEELDKENIFDFFSGLMDSDGHISKRQGDFEYYTVSPNLAEDVLEICTIAGILINKSLRKSKRKNEKNVYRLRIPAGEITKIKNKLSNLVHKDYIKNISNRKKRHLPVVRVKSVSKTNVKDNMFYDLTVKKNSNYLAGKNTFVFIHNTVFHGFIGEKLPSKNAVKTLVKKIAHSYHMPYFTLTPTFSVCPNHGYLSGEHHTCPKCEKEVKCEVYSRVVGYIRPVKQWNDGKQAEFHERKTYNVANTLIPEIKSK